MKVFIALLCVFCLTSISAQDSLSTCTSSDVQYAYKNQVYWLKSCIDKEGRVVNAEYIDDKNLYSTDSRKEDIIKSFKKNKFSFLSDGKIDTEVEVFKVVEQMPRFPGCDDAGETNEEKAKCAEGKMLDYIYKNLAYPIEAEENEVEGMTVIQFVIGVDGSVNDVNIVRDIGAGAGAEAQRIVRSFNDMEERWTPGYQRGRAVKVLYTLPVRFKLEGKRKGGKRY